MTAIPHQKIEASGTEIQNDCISSTVWRIENAVSKAQIVANNNEGKNFIENIDALDTLAISYRYGTDNYVKVFEGIIEEPVPSDSLTQGKLVSATAYGYGKALLKTHCAINFGKESKNSALNDPETIWDDIVDNRINLNFDAGATGYSIGKTKIKAINSPTINHIKGGYRNNFDLINQVCLLVQADQAGSAGVHWFVDPDKNLWIDTIAAHTVDPLNWNTYWKYTSAKSTLTEGVDFVESRFIKSAKDFANKIVLFSDLRKPGYDYWTEDSGGQALWGSNGLTSLTDSAAKFVVGSHSLRLETNGGAPGYAYYPAAANAAWDLTKIGSENTQPHLNFYCYADNNIAVATTYISLMNNVILVDDYYCQFLTNQNKGEWTHFSLPIGPYWNYSSPEHDKAKKWNAAGGTEDWAVVNAVGFYTVFATGDVPLYIDDLHISGKVVREAYNSTSIAANNEYQKPIRLDVSVDDSMKEADDTGTAAQLAYAELLRSQNITTTGTVKIAGAINVLPGQLVYIKSGKQASGSYRIDSVFRVKQATHSFVKGNFVSLLDVTDDVTNTFAYGPNRLLSELSKVLRVDPEAKSLKTTGIDELVERLSIDYP